MNLTRFQIAKADILRFFDELPTRVHSLSDIRRHLAAQREFWRLAQHTTAQDLIRFLVDAGLLSEIVFPFPPPYKRHTRYVWGKTSIYQVMLSLDPRAYFSHYTAVKFHGLTEQLPKTTYLSIELPPTNSKPGTLSQNTIDTAFRRPARVSSNIAETKDFRLCLLSAKNTGSLGVVEETGLPEYGPLRLTNLERTLIDITVRSAYSGGVFEVRKAYELAKDKLSVNRLAAMLQKVDFIYPYHQAIGYYLERAGYKPQLLDLLRRFPVQFDFYLAHNMGKTDYVKPWRLYVPEGF